MVVLQSVYHHQKMFLISNGTLKSLLLLMVDIKSRTGHRKSRWSDRGEHWHKIRSCYIFRHTRAYSYQICNSIRLDTLGGKEQSLENLNWTAHKWLHHFSPEAADKSLCRVVRVCRNHLILWLWLTLLAKTGTCLQIVYIANVLTVLLWIVHLNWAYWVKILIHLGSDIAFETCLSQQFLIKDYETISYKVWWVTLHYCSCEEVSLENQGEITVWREREETLIWWKPLPCHDSFWSLREIAY